MEWFRLRIPNRNRELQVGETMTNSTSSRVKDTDFNDRIRCWDKGTFILKSFSFYDSV